MGKKLTIDFIREEFAKEGYRLVSTEYKNSHSKLNYVCDNGHEHFIVWDAWNKGQRCTYCAGCDKHTYEFIKEQFENKGCTLLSTEYKNNKTKLDYICPNGHEHSITWRDTVAGYGCIHCAHDSYRLDFVDIENSFKQEGYILLSTEYKNVSAKLEYLCPKGHRHSITWRDWREGCRCLYCSTVALPDFGEISKSFKDAGYTLVSQSYKDSMTKLEYMCPHGHTHSMIWNNWRTGHRCPTCATIRMTGPGSPSWRGGLSFEEYCEIWKDRDYKYDIRDRDGHKCLNPYCSSKDPTKLVLHHIDYNKKNCHPTNLVTVCNSCNCKANKDRDWHKDWYQALLHNRYGYNY